MTSINIVTKNKCELNCDVQGDYMLVLSGVTGPYNIVILKGGIDYLQIKSPRLKRTADDGYRIALREGVIRDWTAANNDDTERVTELDTTIDGICQNLKEYVNEETIELLLTNIYERSEYTSKVNKTPEDDQMIVQYTSQIGVIVRQIMTNATIENAGFIHNVVSELIEHQEECSSLQRKIEQRNQEIAVFQRDIENIQANPKPDYIQPMSSIFVREVDPQPSKYGDEIYYNNVWRAVVDDDVITNVNESAIVAMINGMFTEMKVWQDESNCEILEYKDEFSKFEFKCVIEDCSDRFKYLLGISKLPKLFEGTKPYSDVVPIFNGSPYLFIECDKLYSPIRYVWQTDPKIQNAENQRHLKYPAVKKTVSVTYNCYYLNNPFNLSGNQFKVNGNDLCDINFRIVGLWGEDIEFASDLLWTFELNQLPEEDFSNLPGLIPKEEEEETIPPDEPEEQPEMIPPLEPEEETPKKSKKRRR